MSNCIREEPRDVQFFRKHERADEIWMDPATLLPFKAVYLTLNGMPRKYPIEYYFDDLFDLGPFASPQTQDGTSVVQQESQKADPEHVQPDGLDLPVVGQRVHQQADDRDQER